MEGSIYHFDQFTGFEAAAAADCEAQPAPCRRVSGSPKVGLVRNRRSHRNQGQDHGLRAGPQLLIAEPDDRAELPGILAEFARERIDLLVIDGGDGTVRDVLTCGYPVFGNCWPRIAVLPQGKTNALNVDLGAPAGWTIEQAIAAYRTGGEIKRQPLRIASLESRGVEVLGFVIGAGAFTIGIRAGQDAHKMGAFNSLAVGVTAAWGVLQALFGSDRNIWRRGVGMRLWLGRDGSELVHSGFGDPRRREIMLASTLKQLPMGLKVFPVGDGKIGMAVMDKPRRRLLAMLPAVLAGYRPKWLAKAGLHQLLTDRFEIALDDQFILDGETFPAGRYSVEKGPTLSFVVP